MRSIPGAKAVSCVSRRWFVGIVVATTAWLTAWLTACGGAWDAGPATSVWTGPLYEQGHLNARLLGVWRLPGRGRLLQVSQAGYTSYVETRSECHADAPGAAVLESNLPAESQLRGTLRADAETVEVLLLPQLPARLTLQRIPALPSACRLAPATDGAAVFRAFWDMFDQDYAFFAERHMDWRARYDSLVSKAALTNTDADLFAVMRDALTGLGDGHTNLFATTGEPLGFNAANDSPTLALFRQAFQSQTTITDPNLYAAAYAQSVARQISAKLSGDSGPVLNGQMQWGRLAGQVGYIRITQLEGYGAATTTGSTTLADMRLVGAEMDRALAQLADSPALILDIADNGGGEAGVAWEIAGRFCDRKRLAYTASFQRPQGLAPEAWVIEPRGPQQYIKPVYVLSSDATASAAERLVLMLRALPHAVHAGQPTQGIFSEIPPRALPGGHFGVTLSSQHVLDASGLSFEAVGIPPRLAIPLFDATQPETLWTGHATAIDNLLTRIQQDIGTR